MSDILEVLKKLGNFNILLKACKEAGLIDMLSSEGEFTIFAPNDEAFQKLNPEKLQTLFAEPHMIMNLVLFITVENQLTSKELIGTKKLRTVGEDTIKVKAKKNKIKVEGANVIRADVHADNGVIHIIDSVIVPPDMDNLDFSRY